MFKELGNMAAMLRQAQQMKGKLESATEELKNKRVSSSTGGGMVTVEANGNGEVVKLKIDPTLGTDIEMLEDLLLGALKQVSEKSRELHAETMQAVTGEIEVPGLDDALSQFMGGGK